MGCVNKVILVGRLGKDPEIRHTNGGDSVATFSLATSESWKDRGGDKQEKTEWHNIVAWRKLADLANEYLRKGQQLYIEGKLQTREWEDRDGGKRRTTEIVANQLVFLGSGSNGSRREEAEPEQGEFTGATDRDIPF